MEIDCKICKERFMCDQVKYDCPRTDPPLKGGSDELSQEQINEWKALCKGE